MRVELGAEDVLDLGDPVPGFLNRRHEDGAEAGDEFLVAGGSDR